VWLQRWCLEAMATGVQRRPQQRDMCSQLGIRVTRTTATLRSANLIDQQDFASSPVSLAMFPNSDLQNPERRMVPDSATLTLFRCRRRWVVALTSPRLSGEVTLDEMGTDPDAAIEELLCKVGDACPEVAIHSESETSGPEQYEWRLELARLERRTGDLGIAIYAALACLQPRRGNVEVRQMVHTRRCNQVPCSRALCRPLSF
jgi:hypothetical protein